MDVIHIRDPGLRRGFSQIDFSKHRHFPNFREPICRLRERTWVENDKNQTDFGLLQNLVVCDNLGIWKKGRD